MCVATMWIWWQIKKPSFIYLFTLLCHYYTEVSTTKPDMYFIRNYQCLNPALCCSCIWLLPMLRSTATCEASVEPTTRVTSKPRKQGCPELTELSSHQNCKISYQLFTGRRICMFQSSIAGWAQRFTNELLFYGSILLFLRMLRCNASNVA